MVLSRKSKSNFKIKVFKRMGQGMFIYLIGVKQEQHSLTIAVPSDGLRADYGLAISTVNGIPGT